MFAVDSKDVFLVFPSFFGVFCFDMENPPKNIVVLFFWTDMINQDIKKEK